MNVYTYCFMLACSLSCSFVTAGKLSASDDPKGYIQQTVIEAKNNCFPADTTLTKSPKTKPLTKAQKAQNKAQTDLCLVCQTSDHPGACTKAAKKECKGLKLADVWPCGLRYVLNEKVEKTMAETKKMLTDTLEATIGKAKEYCGDPIFTDKTLYPSQQKAKFDLCLLCQTDAHPENCFRAAQKAVDYKGHTLDDAWQRALRFVLERKLNTLF